MKVEFYEKTPSLSLRLRVPRADEERKPNSNNLECHSSSFELIRVPRDRRILRISNELELTRICSNNVERQRSATHG